MKTEMEVWELRERARRLRVGLARLREALQRAENKRIVAQRLLDEINKAYEEGLLDHSTMTRWSRGISVWLFSAKYKAEELKVKIKEKEIELQKILYEVGGDQP